jgi:hypothetical protein
MPALVRQRYLRGLVGGGQPGPADRDRAGHEDYGPVVEPVAHGDAVRVMSVFTPAREVAVATVMVSGNEAVAS